MKIEEMKIEEIENIDELDQIDVQNCDEVYANLKNGFVGYKVIMEEDSISYILCDYLKDKIEFDEFSGYIFSQNETLDLDDLSNSFKGELEKKTIRLRNFIFQNKFEIKFTQKHRVYLIFEECHFFKEVDLRVSNNIDIEFEFCKFRKDLNYLNYYDYIKSIRFACCDIESLTISNSEIENLYMRGGNIKNIFIERTTIINNIDIIDATLYEFIVFDSVRVNGQLNISDVYCNKECYFSIENCTIDGDSEIKFSGIEGNFQLYKTSFHSNCYLDYERLYLNDYECIKKNNDKKHIKWTFYNISEILKRNGKTEYYLKAYAYSKQYERLEKTDLYNGRNFKDKYLKWNGWKDRINISIDVIIEKTTFYFTDWKRCLLWMNIFVFGFFIIYLLFAHKLQEGGKPLVSHNIFYYVANRKISGHIWLVAEKLGSILYFTLITFTTIGYGDISPIGGLRLLAGIEGFIGVIYVSFLTVTLSRRYMN